MMTAEDLARRMAQLDFMREYGDLDPARARELKRAARLAYREEAKARKRARRKVYTEREAGRIAPPRCCIACGGSTFVLEAHHEDHSRPLDVAWLCAEDHRKAVRRLKCR